MKFLVKATVPVEAGNALSGDPNLEQRIGAIMEDIRPEAAYFAVADGQRTMYLIANFDGAHELARIAEPLWLSLRADVEFTPVMDQADFGQAAPLIAQAVQKHA